MDVIGGIFGFRYKVEGVVWVECEVVLCIYGKFGVGGEGVFNIDGESGIVVVFECIDSKDIFVYVVVDV